EMLSRKEVRAAGALSIASNNFMDAGLRNADALEAMGMSENVSGIWRKRHDPAVALQARAANKVSSLLALSKAIRFSLQVLILGAGGWLAIEQVVTPGVMIAASIIMGRALAPVEQAIGAWRGIVQVRAAYSRVDELLTTMPDRTEGTDLPNPKGLLEAENVVAALPGMTEPLIKGVSLKVEPGQIHGIIGPSGAGKSTLGRLLVGVLPTVRGAVRLDGAELINWHPEQRGRHVGYLPQDAALFDGTVAQNISRFDPEGTDDQIITAAQAAGVHDMILRLPQGYDSAVGEGGSNLSGGERQRIALARTLYKDPVLLVLDEPNAALDAEGQQALARAILNAKKRGAGIVLITHDVRFASIADQLTVIKEGAVSLSGPRDEVLARTTKRANPPAQQVTQQAAQTDPTQPTAPEAN
ncbi:MAG: type I secretion system permease/ATPase, partial [Alphaproteobacteria bacterium]